MQEYHYREELRNVVDGYPLWPGDTVSHAGAKVCSERGWIVRQKDGSWIPTALGLQVNTHPFPKLAARLGGGE